MNNKIQKFKREKILTKKDEQDKEENTKEGMIIQRNNEFLNRNKNRNKKERRKQG